MLITSHLTGPSDRGAIVHLQRIRAHRRQHRILDLPRGVARTASRLNAVQLLQQMVMAAYRCLSSAASPIVTLNCRVVGQSFHAVAAVDIVAVVDVVKVVDMVAVDEVVGIRGHGRHGDVESRREASSRRSQIVDVSWGI